MQRQLPGHVEQGPLLQGGRARDSLVAYIFSESDLQYLNNMEFFIRQAVRLDDRCDYVFVLQVRRPVLTQPAGQLGTVVAAARCVPS
jgi:hypothetical protein